MFQGVKMMFNIDSLKFLESFMMTSSPSGFENESAGLFKKYISSFAHKVETDVTGNTIGILNPDAEYKVMLAGHYDEVGFQVTYIDDNGFIYFRNIGSIDPMVIHGIEVEILSGNGRVPGVIGKKPIHLAKPGDRDKAGEMSESWIDIGADDRKGVLKKVSVGDPVTFRSNFKRLGGNKIQGKGMDDKVGAYVVAETLKALSKRKLDIGVCGVGTVQEEIGLRGAETSAYGIKPNVGFAVDVCFASDMPGSDKKQVGDVKLGSGPVIHRNADNNSVLVAKIKDTAKKCKIKIQETPYFRASGGTDAAKIQMSRGGVATALISIPNRYMHTPVEICDLRDVELAVKLLVETISGLKKGEKFIPA